jgi:SHS2 domain-containing protein
MSFNIVSHTADVAVELTAPDMQGMLETTTAALRFLIAGSTNLAPATEAEIMVSGDSLEHLLVRWVNELIFLYDARGQLALSARRIQIRSGADGHRACAQVMMCNTREAMLQPDSDLKAATFHNLAVASVDGGLKATLVIDT